MTIHWCGTGLSAIPGLRHLIEQKFDVHVLGFIPITTLCMSSRKEKVPQ